MKICRRLHSRILFALLFVTLMATACADADLQTVATKLNETQKGLGVFQTTVIEAEKQKLVSEDTTRTLLLAARRVDIAGKEAVAITRGLSRLAPADRGNLLAILNPVIAELNSTQTLTVLNIQNVKTRQTIQASLVTIQTALNAAQLALASR